MRDQVKRLLFEGRKITDRAKAPKFRPDYAVQIRVKLTHAYRMEHAERDAQYLVDNLPVGVGHEVLEFEVYEY